MDPTRPIKKLHIFDQVTSQSRNKDISINDGNPLTKGALVHSVYYHDQIAVGHERAIYSLLDLLGDLGGVTEVMMIVFCFLLLPISEHSFIVKAMKKLYIARTRETDLFLPAKSKKPRKTKTKFVGGVDKEAYQKKIEA